jgi:hypothetical protein
MSVKKPSKHDVFDILFHDERDITKLRQIRARESYSFWKMQYEVLRHQRFSVKQTESLLRWVHCIINVKYGYHSSATATYSEESLDQVVMDKRVGRI